MQGSLFKVLLMIIRLKVEGNGGVLGISDVGGGREKAGKAPAAGRREVKLVTASITTAVSAEASRDYLCRVTSRGNQVGPRG
jgi:hypothetical protein